MEWKCFTCEHINGTNSTECEVCGSERNLYAEQVFEHLLEIKNLQKQIRESEKNLQAEKEERDILIEELSDKSYEIEQLSQTSISQKNEIKNLKDREKQLFKTITTNENLVKEINVKLVSLNKTIIEKDKSINNKEGQLKTKELNIKELQSSIHNLTAKINKRKPLQFGIWLLLLASISLGAILFYTQFYIPNLKSNCIVQTKQAFSNYINSLVDSDCKKEDVEARTILAVDLNNDGKLDGVIISIFEGINCKNALETDLYVYDGNKGLINPPLSLQLLSTKDNYISFQGSKDGKLVFDKWKIKNFNQKKYNAEQLKNSHSNIYITIQGDTLSTTTL